MKVKEYYMATELSNCCGTPRWGETDLCSDCFEHADFEEESEDESETIDEAFSKMKEEA